MIKPLMRFGSHDETRGDSAAKQPVLARGLWHIGAQRFFADESKAVITSDDGQLIQASSSLLISLI
ncbi:hypothetical protein VNPA142037_28660 [Pseudomonas aeruginosa]|nr:hypothetical protein VNPA120840_54130 [Pseudomonas aeruginosa]GLF65074.1 hypothetical protein VNPA142037_28660 [Pseudomonas aeruginosa]